MSRKKYYEEGEPRQRTDFHRPTRSIPHKKDKLKEQDYYEDLDELGEPEPEESELPGIV